MRQLTDIITFSPIYKSVIWGGRHIAALKGEPHSEVGIGESWEMSVIPGHESIVNNGPLAGFSLPELCKKYGENLLGRRVVERMGHNFPLLIKFIDARDILSVQVHPEGFDPQLDYPEPRDARQRGKSELWYVIDCHDDSIIYDGLAAPLDPETFSDHVCRGSIMDILGSYKSRPGQFYYLPAGTIHAIGAGNLIAEIQESSDLTYRIYDFDRRGRDGRPRDLHIDKARQVIDYRYPNPITPTATVYDRSTQAVVDSPQFVTDYIALDDDEAHRFATTPGSFTILMVVQGSVTIQTPGHEPHVLTQCHTALIPAAVASFTLSGKAKVLSVHC